MAAPVDPADEICTALSSVLLRVQLVDRALEGDAAVPPTELRWALAEVEDRVRRIAELVTRIERGRTVLLAGDPSRASLN